MATSAAKAISHDGLRQPEYSSSRYPGSLIFSRYKVQSIAGYGTTGVVYCCRDNLNRGELVAVKLFDDGDSKSPHARRRYRNEIRLARAVRHRGIISVRDALEDRDSIGYVMDFVPGGELSQLLFDCPNLRQEDWLRIFVNVARALRALHAAGIMHRYIKAENILLTEQLEPKLIDFGLAIDAEVGTVAAEAYNATSVNYLSPETILRDYYDKRSEVYALGVLGYRILAGTFPFPDSGGKDFVIARTRSDPPPLSEHNPEVSREVGEIIIQCLNRDPKKRYASAIELLSALEDTAIYKRISNENSLSKASLTGEVETKQVHRLIPSWWPFTFAAGVKERV